MSVGKLLISGNKVYKMGSHWKLIFHSTSFCLKSSFQKAKYFINREIFFVCSKGLLKKRTKY